MLLLILTLVVALAGLTAAEFGQAARPREIAAWNDDLERRLLRVRSAADRW